MTDKLQNTKDLREDINKNSWQEFYNLKNSVELKSLFNSFDEFDREEDFTKRVLFYAQKTNAKKCLEFGSGMGFTSLFLAINIPNLCPTLLDFSGISLKISKYFFERKNVKANFLEQNIPPISLKTNTFDIVFGNTVLEHIFNYKDAFSELVRVMKEGGYIIITVPNKLRIDGALWYHNAYKVRHFTKNFFLKELISLCKENGIEIIEKFGSGYFYIDPMMIASLFGLSGLVLKYIGTAVSGRSTYISKNNNFGKFLSKVMYILKFFNGYWIRIITKLNRALRIVPVPPSTKIVIGIVGRKRIKLAA